MMKHLNFHANYSKMRSRPAFFRCHCSGRSGLGVQLAADTPSSRMLDGSLKTVHRALICPDPLYTTSFLTSVKNPSMRIYLEKYQWKVLGSSMAREETNDAAGHTKKGPWKNEQVSVPAKKNVCQKVRYPPSTPLSDRPISWISQPYDPPKPHDSSLLNVLPVRGGLAKKLAVFL